MRHYPRQPLSADSLQKLAELTAEVAGAPAPKDKAASKWDSKPKACFNEVRATLLAMASGLERCMYCEDSHGADIEHFWPKSEYPERCFIWENYLLACPECNSRYKRAKFPLDPSGGPILIDPTVDQPLDHMDFLPSTGAFYGNTLRGDETIEFFDLNKRISLLEGRKNTFLKLEILLNWFDNLLLSNPSKADSIRAALLAEPFSYVLHWVVHVHSRPRGLQVLGDELHQLIIKHEVARWL